MMNLASERDHAGVDFGHAIGQQLRQLGLGFLDRHVSIETVASEGGGGR